MFIVYLLKISMKKTTNFSKIRLNRIKYLKLFPLFIQDIDQVIRNIFSKIIKSIILFL